jgi:hypothetical protein
MIYVIHRGVRVGEYRGVSGAAALSRMGDMSFIGIYAVANGNVTHGNENTQENTAASNATATGAAPAPAPAAAAARWADPASYAAALRKWLDDMPAASQPPPSTPAHNTSEISPAAAAVPEGEGGAGGGAGGGGEEAAAPEYDRAKCAVMLDVRTAREYEEGHVSCATRLPVQVLRQ